MRSLLFQQLAGPAAAAIMRRWYGHYGDESRTPTPKQILATSDEDFRACGISRQKMGYLRDLAAHVADGRLPFERLDEMSDAEVQEALTAVKGVGEWTAHMMLMFHLGRPDVLPVGDLGVRNGMKAAYGLAEQPTPKQALEIGAKWSPYSSVASWYMWQVLEIVTPTRPTDSPPRRDRSMTSSNREAQIGFIGAGNIGNPMARQMIAAGHQLVVFDLRPEAIENLLELGADAADSPADIAARCSVVFTSLPGPVEVEAVVTDPDGILAGASEGDIHVDLSSNSITTVQRLAALEAERGLAYIDAPVTGGVPGAEAGTLTVLGSGDTEAFDRVRPYLGGDRRQHLPPRRGRLRLPGQADQQHDRALRHPHRPGSVRAGRESRARTGPAARTTAPGHRRPYLGLAPYLLGRRFENPLLHLRLAEKDVSLALEAAAATRSPCPSPMPPTKPTSAPCPPA